MATRENSRDIDRAASAWTARLDRGVLSQAEQAAFHVWQEADPRHKGALLRAQALTLLSESGAAFQTGSSFDLPQGLGEPVGRRLFSRRGAMIATGGAGAAIASLAIVGISMPAAGAVVETARGEMRLVPLGGGSTVLLNTDSGVKVESRADRLRVTILRGEAFFSVACNEGVLFTVSVDGRTLTAQQAQFRVRKLDRAPVDILVQQGQVALAGPALTIGANMHVLLSRGAAGHRTELPQPLSPDAVVRELAWREGKLAFEGETLAQAAAQFARYSDRRILVADPVLAREPVVGLYAANDPTGFSRAVARVFDAQLEEDGPGLTLRRNPRAP